MNKEIKEIAIQHGVPVVNDSLKKNIILEAYENALNVIKSLSERKTDTQAIIKQKEVEKDASMAEEIIELGILDSSIVEKYNSLNKTIEKLENEIEELYSIKRELNSLEALINTNTDKTLELENDYKDKKAGFDKKLAQKEAEVNESIKKLEEAQGAKIKELEKVEKLKKEDLDRKRERDEEEYKYDLSRKHKKEENDFKDKQQLKEKELEEREKAIKVKEIAVEEKEQELQSLKEQVETMPEKINEGIEAETQRLKEKHDKAIGSAVASAKKEAEWEKKMSEQKIDNLQKELDKLSAQNAELQEKLNQAYKEVKEIATETVKASGVKVIETSASK